MWVFVDLLKAEEKCQLFNSEEEAPIIKIAQLNK